MVMVKVAKTLLTGVRKALFVSRTWKVTDLIPALVGVPDSTPVEEKERPGGRRPPPNLLQR